MCICSGGRKKPSTFGAEGWGGSLEGWMGDCATHTPLGSHIRITLCFVCWQGFCPWVGWHSFAHSLGYAHAHL